MFSFLEGIGNDIQNYIVDVCKLDVINTTNDREIGKMILEMTNNRYGMIKTDYKNIDGLSMLTKGTS